MSKTFKIYDIQPDDLFSLKEDILEGYLINKNGDVFSTKGKAIKKLKTVINNSGYTRIHFTINGKTVMRTVHRLVAETFIPNPKNKTQVNHINGNKLDNRVENLEWVTASENLKHAFKNGLNKSPMLNPETAKKHSEKLKGKFTDKQFEKSAKKVVNVKTGETYKSIKEAAKKENYSYQHFSKMLRGIVNNKSNCKYA